MAAQTAKQQGWCRDGGRFWFPVAGLVRGVVVALGTGREQRNVDWSSQRCSFDISYGIQYKEDFIDVVKFFYARLGKARGFRFKDWSDFEAVNEQIGIGDGTTTIFQLVKNYTSLVVYQRKITRPVAGTVAVRVNGATVPYTVNNNTGVVTFTSAPAAAAVIMADFEFDVPMRFENDEMPISHDTYEVYSWGNITLIEIKV